MEIFDQEKLQAYILMAAQQQSCEEDLDYNKLDTTLKSIDIQLKDANGQFRSLNDILLELSEKWNILENNKNEKVFIIPIEEKPVKIIYEGKPIDENETVLELLKHLWEINDAN